MRAGIAASDYCLRKPRGAGDLERWWWLVAESATTVEFARRTRQNANTATWGGTARGPPRVVIRGHSSAAKDALAGVARAWWARCGHGCPVLFGRHGQGAASSQTPPPSSMSSRALPSSLPATPSRQGRSDPGRIAPFLTHVVAHHGRLTLTPPQNAGRIRKGGKTKAAEKARPERRRDADEPRFNTAAPASPRGPSRRGNTTSERSPRPAPAVSSRFSRGA